MVGSATEALDLDRPRYGTWEGEFDGRPASVTVALLDGAWVHWAISEPAALFPITLLATGLYTAIKPHGEDDIIVEWRCIWRVIDESEVAGLHGLIESGLAHFAAQNPIVLDLLGPGN